MNEKLKLLINKYQNIPDFIGIKIRDINTRNLVNDQLLHIVCINDDISGVKDILDQGADINEKGEDGFTPLHYAVEQKHEKLVCLLLERGADKTIENKFSQTPLRLAEDLGFSKITQILV